MSKRALIILGVNPFTSQTGDSVRALSYLEALISLKMEIEIALVDQNSDNNARTSYSDPPQGSSIKFFDADIRTRKLKKINVHFIALFEKMLPWIARTKSKSLQSYLRREGGRFHFIIYIGEVAAANFVPQKGIFTIWDKSNVLSSSIESERKETKRVLEKVRFSYHLRLAHKFETKRVNWSDLVIVTSEEEYRRLRIINARCPIEVLKSAHGVYDPIPHNKTAHAIAWIGSFQYGANWRGLLRFLNEANSELVSAGISLRVIGSGMSVSQKRTLSMYQSVDIVGFVEVIRDQLHDIRALVVPLWSGAGVKLKSLEALRFGIPLIGTPTAMEGISEKAAFGVAEGSKELAKHCELIPTADFEEYFEIVKREYAENFSQEAFTKNLKEILGRANLL